MLTTEIAKTFLEFLKLAPRYLIALSVMAASLLFSSHQLLEQIGVVEFVKNNRSVLGITLVVTVSLFVVSVAADAISLIKEWWRRRKLYRHITDKLHTLTEDEKQILRFYLANNTRSNMLRIDDGVVQGLKSDGIIYQSASLGSMHGGFAHNISNVAWDYLHEHQHLLTGTTNTYRTDKDKWC